MTSVTTERGFSLNKMQGLISPQRLKPYLDQSGGAPGEALKLYEWSARMAGAAFETLAQLEVIMRNAIDAELSTYYTEAECGIPWFLLRPPMNDETTEAVTVVRDRLRPLDKDTRHQIVAGLSFGFWSGMLGRRYEDLWRAALRHAFPGSSGNRKQVAADVEAIRKFRNRLAHHDSMLKVDIPFEMRRVIEVAQFISPDAAMWLGQIDRSSEVYKLRPHSPIDTVVVAARYAWPFYEKQHAYVCQAGRSFRPVDRISFYADHENEADIPRILDRRDNVPWTDHQVSVLENSSDRMDRKVAAVIKESRNAGWNDGVYQVFLLTRPGDPSHRSLVAPIRHHSSGPGSAFVRGQRYVSLHALETAKATSEL